MTVPLTTSAASIPRFLDHIRDAGVPDKVTNPYLRSVGFKSSNDSALIGVFKALGFVDASGSPTQTWKSYRDATKGKAVLGGAIKKCYEGLFKIYSDAHRKDDEAIANWIRSNTTLGGVTVDRAVRTFKALCAGADFNSTAPVVDTTPEQSAPAPEQKDTAVSPLATSLGMSPNVNINIELHMPATNEPEVYEHFFEAMKKHLFNESKAS